MASFVAGCPIASHDILSTDRWRVVSHTHTHTISCFVLETIESDMKEKETARLFFYLLSKVPSTLEPSSAESISEATGFRHSFSRSFRASVAGKIARLVELEES